MASDGTALGYRLTPARRQALEVLFRLHPSPARYSNGTWVTASGGAVYWQSANWLVEKRLAYYPSGSTWLALTSSGIAAARELFPELDPENAKLCRVWECERAADSGGYCRVHQGGRA